MAETPFRKVRIVRTPEGEAPLWVREAWVGLELPLAHPGEITTETVGVLTGPPSPLGRWWARLRGRPQLTTGYFVLSARAIGILARSQPRAADWWRSNTPRFCDPHELFVFDAPACEPSIEPIADSPWG